MSLATQAPVLAYYDPKVPLTLSVDASSTGLGATLLQRGKPIAYASRALTDTQTRYAQIEKEMLAISFGCQKFHQYVYMRQVDVETDHKPLQAIFKKPLHDAPPRLQKIMMTLQRYDLNVQYRPGKELLIADHLSSSYLKETGENPELPDIEVNLSAYLPVSGSKLKVFQVALAQDETSCEVCEYVKNGWPTLPTDISTRARQYWTYREEMTCVDGLVFKSHKLVVPASLRKDMLNRIYDYHLGMVKSKSRARETLFWPGMATDIESTVAKCEVCARYQKANPLETLMSSEVPDRPWAKIGTDLFDFKGNTYLLTVDYFSKWPDMARLEGTTSQNIIAHLKSQFARYGIPDILMSDNGPQYESAEFKKFAADYDFEHVTSSPRFPQSNGQAERTVQTLKNILKKATDLYRGLLDYRNSPLEGVGKSPAQLFMGRRLRSNLPVAAPLLRSESSVRNRQSLINRQTNQQKYNPGQSDLKPLLSGSRVMMREDHIWIPAQVVAKHSTPRSYLVQTETGRTYRRNRRDLKETQTSGSNPQELIMKSPMKAVTPSLNTKGMPALSSFPVPSQPSAQSSFLVVSRTPVTTTAEKPVVTENSAPVVQPASPARQVTRSGRVVVMQARFSD